MTLPIYIEDSTTKSNLKVSHKVAAFHDYNCIRSSSLFNLEDVKNTCFQKRDNISPCSQQAEKDLTVMRLGFFKQHILCTVALYVTIIITARFLLIFDTRMTSKKICTKLMIQSIPCTSRKQVGYVIINACYIYLPTQRLVLASYVKHLILIMTILD